MEFLVLNSGHWVTQVRSDEGRDSEGPLTVPHLIPFFSFCSLKNYSHKQGREDPFTVQLVLLKKMYHFRA